MSEEEDSQEGPKVRNVTAEEFADAYQQPAVFVNKTILSVAGPMARLTFVERRENEGALHSHARVSIAMSLGDLLKLRALIDEMSSKIQEIDVRAIISAAEERGKDTETRDG